MIKLTFGVCLFASLSFGQSFTGSIRGTITDSTQAAVPTAKVTATDTDRKIEYPTQADASGRYIFPTSADRVATS